MADIKKKLERLKRERAARTKTQPIKSVMGEVDKEAEEDHELEASLRDCGFDIVRSGDRALTADADAPWYSPLETGWSPRGFLHTEAGAWLTHRLVGLLELSRLSPPGTTDVHDLLRLGQHSLVEGGRTGIFTPMYFFLAGKPA